MSRITLRIFLLVISWLSLILCFQNCEFINKDSKSSSANLSEGNGHPYDGKPYIEATLCPDSALVASRLVTHKDGSATLYRSDCENHDPKTIDAADLQFRNSEITYGNKSFKLEKAPIALDPLPRWNYQLTGNYISRNEKISVLDSYNETAQSIQALKDQGKIVICSMSAGTREGWRDDANQFPQEVVGNLAGDNEYYVDIRSPLVRQIMTARIKSLKALGCQGVDFDNVDGYLNATGFPLQRHDQLAYNQFLAFSAHDYGLIMALNNTPELASDLSEFFDLVVTEECFSFNECGDYRSFTQKRKPVLSVSYSGYSAALCQEARELGHSLIFASIELDGSSYVSCQ